MSLFKEIATLFATACTILNQAWLKIDKRALSTQLYDHHDYMLDNRLIWLVNFVIFNYQPIILITYASENFQSVVCFEQLIYPFTVFVCLFLALTSKFRRDANTSHKQTFFLEISGKKMQHRNDFVEYKERKINYLQHFIAVEITLFYHNTMKRRLE